MLAGSVWLVATERLVLVFLVLLAAITLYNSVGVSEPGNRVRPTAAALLSGTVPACNFGSQPYYFVESESAQFNETPSSWQLRAYDPGCQPRALWEFLVGVDHSNGSRAGSDTDGGAAGNGCSVDSGRQLTAIIYGDRRGSQTNSLCAIMMTASRFSVIRGTTTQVAHGPRAEPAALTWHCIPSAVLFTYTHASKQHSQHCNRNLMYGVDFAPASDDPR